MTDRNTFIYVLMAGIYCAAVALCGFHGTKLLDINGLTFDAGLITYAIPFLITDICSEVFGKKYSKNIVFAGLASIVVVILTTKLSLLLPASMDWELEGEYGAIFDSGMRISMAVIATFIVSQLADIYIFSYLKNKTNGKHLWFRNNASTLVAGMLDAIVFSTIAFYGVYPVLPIIISAYIARIILSLADTPLVYLGVWLIKRKS